MKHLATFNKVKEMKWLIFTVDEENEKLDARYNLVRLFIHKPDISDENMKARIYELKLGSLLQHRHGKEGECILSSFSIIL